MTRRRRGRPIEAALWWWGVWDEVKTVGIVVMLVGVAGLALWPRSERRVVGLRDGPVVEAPVVVRPMAVVEERVMPTRIAREERPVTVEGREPVPERRVERTNGSARHRGRQRRAAVVERGCERA